MEKVQGPEVGLNVVELGFYVSEEMRLNRRGGVGRRTLVGEFSERDSGGYEKWNFN